MLSTDCSWQNTAGASTQTRKEQMAPQIYLKGWATRRCWKTWIFPTVVRSQHWPGKNCMVPSGWTWRRHISDSASLREMVEGFSCFLRAFICLCWKLFEIRSMVRFVKLSCELELTWIGYCIPAQIDSYKTLQVLRQRRPRSRWRRRFASSLEPIVPAGRVGSFLL